jgi:hypothetical protein
MDEIEVKKPRKINIETGNKKSSFKKWSILAIILIAIIGIGAFAYNRYTKTEGYLSKKAQKEAKATIDSARELIILPEGEPSIFVVQDPDLLASQQAFFKGSVKGDQLLVYPESGKAIIYSPSRNIIVNSGPVTFDDKDKQGLPTKPKTDTQEPKA